MDNDTEDQTFSGNGKDDISIFLANVRAKVQKSHGARPTFVPHPEPRYNDGDYPNHQEAFLIKEHKQWKNYNSYLKGQFAENLRKGAKLWYDNYLRNPDNRGKTYQEQLVDFKDKYKNTEYKTHKEDKFDEIKMFDNESVVDYFERISMACSQAYPGADNALTHEMLKKKLLSTLPPLLKKEARKHIIKDAKDERQHIARMDAHANNCECGIREDPRFHEAYEPITLRQIIDELDTEMMADKVSNLSLEDEDVNQITPDQQPPTTPTSFMSTICTFCQRRGHSTEDCRKRQRQDTNSTPIKSDWNFGSNYNNPRYTRGGTAENPIVIGSATPPPRFREQNTQVTPGKWNPQEVTPPNFPTDRRYDPNRRYKHPMNYDPPPDSRNGKDFRHNSTQIIPHWTPPAHDPYTEWGWHYKPFNRWTPPHPQHHQRWRNTQSFRGRRDNGWGPPLRRNPNILGRSPERPWRGRYPPWTATESTYPYSKTFNSSTDGRANTYNAHYANERISEVTFDDRLQICNQSDESINEITDLYPEETNSLND